MGHNNFMEPTLNVIMEINLGGYFFLRHSKLRNISLVGTKMHVILRRYALFTWMRDKKRSIVACDVME